MRTLCLTLLLTLTLSCAAHRAPDFEHLSARVRALVVRVEADGGGKGRAASGFFVTESRIVTVLSAIEGAEEVRLRAPDGSWTLARIIGSDEANDLALLEPVPPPTAPASPLKVARSLARPGADVLVAGYPGDYNLSVVVTSVAASGVPLESDAAEEMLLLQGSPRRGIGGAPVVDARGEVAGIVMARQNETHGFAPALSAAVLEGAVAGMMEGASPEGLGFAGVGLEVREVSEVRALRVERVFEDSAAERAGILVGDLIVGIAERRAESLDFAAEILARWRTGREVPLVIQRELRQIRLRLSVLN